MPELRFGILQREARQDAIQEVIANALVAFVRLVRRRKDRAWPTRPFWPATPWHRSRTAAGSGNRLNFKDVLVPILPNGKRASSSSDWTSSTAEDGQWIEAVVEDHHTPVPDQVAFRCDFPPGCAACRVAIGESRRPCQSVTTPATLPSDSACRPAGFRNCGMNCISRGRRSTVNRPTRRGPSWRLEDRSFCWLARQGRPSRAAVPARLPCQAFSERRASPCPNKSPFTRSGLAGSGPLSGRTRPRMAPCTASPSRVSIRMTRMEGLHQLRPR